jgi:ABC-2 type transport system ATP-binding protein
MTLALDAVALTKRYGRRAALRGVNLAVERGRVVGLIGPNGAGKTTTMRILLDIIRPTSGEVRILGENPRAGGPSLRRRIGYLPGELIMDARVTAGALLTHYAALNGDAHAQPRIAILAERLGLDLSRPVRALSKGNKQKVGLIQAFSHRPEILVLDEPTSGLDPLVQQEFLALVREATDDGQTVLLSSHVISEIEQAADEVAILRDGAILSVTSVAELRASAPRDVRVTVAPADADRVAAGIRAIATTHDVAVQPSARGTVISARFVDGLTELIAALATHDILDLVVAEPDLERTVLQYYATPTRDETEDKR